MISMNQIICSRICRKSLTPETDDNNILKHLFGNGNYMRCCIALLCSKDKINIIKDAKTVKEPK